MTECIFRILVKMFCLFDLLLYVQSEKYATVHLKNQFTTIINGLPKIKLLPKFTLANDLIIKPDTNRNVSLDIVSR